MIDTALDFGKIIIADLILSGDNAIIIAMAAAGLAPPLRKKAILFGMILAAILRIIFAIIATKLLAIKGLLFIGSILLFWVCWRLFTEIRATSNNKMPHDTEQHHAGTSNTTLMGALFSILIADISMSLDNVLAVAAIADGDTTMLVFGLGLAIILMAFAATIIMKILTKYPWISWLGLFVLIYVAAEMMYRGFFDATNGIGPMMGWIEGIHFNKEH